MQALKHNVWIVALSLMLALFWGQTSRAEDILWADPLDPQVSVAFVGQNFSIAALLDTGANFSVIDKKLADKMNVKHSEEKVETYFPAAGRTVDLFIAKPFEITISANAVPLTISPIVIDFSAYEAGELEPLKLPSQLPEGRGISFEIDVLVGGEIINCVVDTGAPDIPGVFIQTGHPRFEALREKFDFFDEMDEGFSTSGTADATHDPKARVSTLSGKGLLIEFEIHDHSKELGDQCWLGGGVLQNVKMRRAGKGASLKSKIDGFYSEGVLSPVRYNRLGFSHVDYNTETKLFVLKELVPHGGLAKAGIRDGDVLLSINGITAELDNVEKLRDIARGPAGEKVTVVVRRPSEKADEPNPEESYEITLTDVLVNQ